eukprot:m.102838 g.102838  ORF g.102838 m.102838 type:complete len:70 (+) comp27441_c0_seq3:1082-1291(+)
MHDPDPNLQSVCVHSVMVGETLGEWCAALAGSNAIETNKMAPNIIVFRINITLLNTSPLSNRINLRANG